MVSSNPESSLKVPKRPVKRAIVLVSGGLDSATCLAIAAQESYDIYGLSIDYGQRHSAELNAAKELAKDYGVVDHKRVQIDFNQIGGSSLTDLSMAVPEAVEMGVPNTYVPARNTLFLSIAMGWAEVLEARHLFIGANAVDYSGYPDCRPEFLQAFESMANLATRIGVEEGGIRVHAPLVDWSKSRIITEGSALGVDYGATVSCYQADPQGRACGRCDSCALRRKGFEDAGIADPTTYQA